MSPKGTPGVGLTGPVLLLVLLVIRHGQEDWVGQLTPAQRSPIFFKATAEEVASTDAALESFTCNHGGTVQAFNLSLPQAHCRQPWMPYALI